MLLKLEAMNASSGPRIASRIFNVQFRVLSERRLSERCSTVEDQIDLRR